MKIKDLRDKLSKDEQFQRAYAEDELITRVAIHAYRKRMERGLTQAQVADLLEKDQAWISRLEAAEMNMTLRTLAKIARAFECDASALTAPVDQESPVTA